MDYESGQGLAMGARVGLRERLRLDWRSLST